MSTTKELNLLALHVHKNADGEWYIVAAVIDENGERVTRTFFSSETKRPILDTFTGELTWEQRIP